MNTLKPLTAKTGDHVFVVSYLKKYGYEPEYTIKEMSVAKRGRIYLTVMNPRYQYPYNPALCKKYQIENGRECTEYGCGSTVVFDTVDEARSQITSDLLEELLRPFLTFNAWSALNTLPPDARPQALSVLYHTFNPIDPDPEPKIIFIPAPEEPNHETD